MTEAQAQAPESLEYRTEVKQLLDILAHSLYTDREIFLRELISNASDALNRVQFEMLTNHDVVDPDAKLAITITYDNDAGVITISDTGIGMNHDELIANLGTIAHSGAKDFIREAKEEKVALEDIIGQFGVGFYSVFMAAKEVTVTTRSYRPDDRAWTWRSTGDSSYTVEPADKATRGTDIRVTLKDDAKEFASGWRLEQIIKQHSDYVSFPIYVVDANAETEEGEEAPQPEPVNRQTALWRQSASSVSDEEYDEFYKQLTFDFNAPMLHMHMVADSPVNVRSILYVPSKRERQRLGMGSETGLRLYSRKILIQRHNKDLLPDYLRFVEGVVDSEDLPLNVSREMVQSNPVMRHLRKALTNRVLKEVRTLAEKEPEKYAQFWDEFGVFLKEGIAVEPGNQESLADLLRFHSLRNSGADVWTSLRAYVDGMKDDQTEIYYVLGEDLRSVARSPHLDSFRKHDIDVLYLVDPIDGFMVSMLREFDGKPLRNIDDAGLDLPAGDDESTAEDTPPVDEGELDDLMARFRSVLGDRIVDVRTSKTLVSSPCRLVTPEDNYDRDLQRLRRLMEEDYEDPKKILEINRSHPLVANVAHLLHTDAANPLIDVTVEQLFANAQLLDGIQPSPADMVERVQKLMEAAVASKSQGAA
ncbi:MAG: molecular chaperone HtpG [Caldilineaceae bacterium]